MAAMGRLAKAVSLLQERGGQSNARYVDMAVSLRVADVETLPDGTKRWVTETEETLITLGGLWDTKRKKYVGRARKVAVIRVHRGQERAARWLADWFRRRACNSWADFRKVNSLLFLGGRRSGKSHMSVVALILFVVAFPRCNRRRALVWAISPTQDETDELEQAIRELMPRKWYRFRGAGAGKVVTFTLVSSARLKHHCGHKPRGLKRGRVDFCLYNEAQNQHKAGYVQLRGAIADTGGIVVLAANPPDAPIGRWVEEHYERSKAGKIACEAFDFDPQANPWIDYSSLASMREEVDEVTYNREVLGLMQPIGDVVFHAWSDRESWKDPEPDWVDVTAEVTKAKLGRAFGYVVGADFQQTPHMTADVYKFFRDPKFPGEILPVVVDEFVCEDADENDLIDAMEASSRWVPGRAPDASGGSTYRGWFEEGDSPTEPVACAVVMDASAWWQDGAHTKGRTSDQAFRARRWVHLFKPQEDSDRNPDIVERAKVGNSCLKVASGRRRMRVARHCIRTAQAMKQWENKGGVPFRRSVHAHICDAATYPLYRFFGRPKVKHDAAKVARVRPGTRRSDVKSVI